MKMGIQRDENPLPLMIQGFVSHVQKTCLYFKGNWKPNFHVRRDLLSEDHVCVDCQKAVFREEQSEDNRWGQCAV